MIWRFFISYGNSSWMSVYLNEISFKYNSLIGDDLKD